LIVSDQVNGESTAAAFPLQCGASDGGLERELADDFSKDKDEDLIWLVVSNISYFP
jgi:hypothetical protein